MKYKLTLLVRPEIMSRNKNEAIYRKLFTEHEYTNHEEIVEFLNNHNIRFTNCIGTNEDDERMMAYRIDDVYLFGINLTKTLESEPKT